MSPAVLSGEERELLSRTSVGNTRVLRARFARFFFRVRE